jgi:diguanylate cyclase (GGDEF)-like protein/PAS domain S-box-containing protein
MFKAVAASNSLHWLWSLVVFCASMGIGFAWINHSELQEQNQRKSLAADLASDHSHALQRGIERALSANYAIAALVRQGEGRVRDFDAVATEMLTFYPGISALSISPGGVICCVVPKAGNEKSVGFNQLGDIAQNKEARRAIETGVLTLAGPMNLAQGGQGVVGRLPIFLMDDLGQKTFWGFSNVTLRFPQALGTARLSLLTERGYAYELWRTVPDSGAHQTIEASANTVLGDPVTRTFELPNGLWALSLEPLHGWDDPKLLAFKIALALLLSSLLSYLTWLLNVMRMRDNQLETLVQERTREILATKQHLEATINAIPDLLFEVGLDGRYYSSHSPRRELLARPEDELQGHTVSEIMPPEAAHAVLEALKEANEKTWSGGVQIALPLDIGLRWFELSVARKRTEPGQEPRFVVLSRDITDNKRAEEKILQLAHFDVLTGLPNRALLADRCSHAVSTAQRYGQSVSLLFVDLDHFKNVNDSLGHRVGDELLKAMAQRLSAAVRDQDTVARLGGDEFVLVLPDTDGPGAARVVEKIMRVATDPFDIDSRELIVTPSIGIAVYPQDGADFDALSRCADTAMYDAKQRGRSQYRFFTAELQAKSQRTLVLENALRRALEREQLHLHYQPLVATGSGTIIGVEALLRWNHSELGPVSPAEFIPVAENCGLILPIGEWVLRTAIRQLKVWLDQNIAPITVAVNLSTAQFRQTELPQLIGEILKDENLPAHLLELELTEGAAMSDPNAAIATMDKLHQLGVHMAIDDFGTGYSSLNYLKKFNVFKLKIDQSFVRDIAHDADDRAIVNAIISMAASLGIRTIAEGVETAEQLAYLRAQGCDEVQGYYFSRPVPPEALFELLSKQ